MYRWWCVVWILALAGPRATLIAQTTFEGSWLWYPPGSSTPVFDDHWDNALVWTNGIPNASTPVEIRNSQTVTLPTTVAGAATARSLSILATEQNAEGKYVPQTVTISDGTLNLTPLALGDALRVGAASTGNSLARETTLVLSSATLTSTGFAYIGSGVPVGSGGALTAELSLRQSAWYHPAGRIEIGSVQLDPAGNLASTNGFGFLYLRDGLAGGSTLAGSLIPGVAANPSLIINNGRLEIARNSTARLSELTVDRTVQGEIQVVVFGHLETSVLTLGTFGPAYLVVGGLDPGDGGSAALGTVEMKKGGALLFQGGSSVTASLLNLIAGFLLVHGTSDFTVGLPSSSGQTLKVAAELGESTGVTIDQRSLVDVHGSALLGGYGTAIVDVLSGGTLNIRGDATVGRTSTYRESDANGSGLVTVTGADSKLRAENIAIGHEQDSFRTIAGTVGRLDVGSGGRVEVAGKTVADSSYNPFIGALVSYTYNYGGSLTVGRYGLLDLLNGTGKVLFTDPSAGAILSTPASLTNYGTITGGDSTGGAPPAGGQIDFGDRGGTLTNRGTISPGHSAGWLTIGGDLTLEATSTLLLELGSTTRGSGYDALTVTGALSAGGALTVSLINGYSPTSGASFDLLDFGSISGTFATVTLPVGYAWNMDALYTTGVISLGAVPEPSTYALGAGLGALGVAVVRRRRALRRGLLGMALR